MRTRIVLDADTGIDDTLALSYLLASPEADLLGVVGTYGNVLGSTAVRNSRDVLATFGRGEIPVFHGSTRPSWSSDFQVDEACRRFHGDNGLGNAMPPVHATQGDGGHHPGDGVRFIHDVVARYGHGVTIVATGPTTDVSAAIAIEPALASQMHVVIMGGALTQPGNCYDGVSETNIWQDPQAADTLFRSGAQVTMVGIDVTHQVLLTRGDTAAWSATGTVRGRFLARMTEWYLAANEASDPVFLAGSPMHDPLAAAVALDPALVSTFPINLRVELRTGRGSGVRGRTIGDPTRLREAHKTAAVALNVDAGRFLTRFRARIGALLAS